MVIFNNLMNTRTCIRIFPIQVVLRYFQSLNYLWKCEFLVSISLFLTILTSIVVLIYIYYIYIIYMTHIYLRIIT